jgi:phosphoketolase
MLYNKKHEDGDIVVLKLVTGEEVIAKLVEGNMEHIKISKPMMIVHTPKGLAMSQYIMMQDINDAIVIDVNKVIAVTSANKVASSQYQETVSSIKVPTQAEKSKIIQ